jgi:hypothetical protein
LGAGPQETTYLVVSFFFFQKKKQKALFCSAEDLEMTQTFREAELWGKKTSYITSFPTEAKVVLPELIDLIVSFFFSPAIDKNRRFSLWPC